MQTEILNGAEGGWRPEAESSRLEINLEDKGAAIPSRAYANKRNEPKPPEPVGIAFYGSLTTA